MSEGKRGRTPGFVMSAEHRTKIANSQILKRLIDYFEGKEGVTLEPGQITVGLGLLKKVLPDLQSTSITGDEDGDPVRIIITGVPRAGDAED